MSKEWQALAAEMARLKQEHGIMRRIIGGLVEIRQWRKEFGNDPRADSIENSLIQRATQLLELMK